jgi:hypothetical protein
MRTIVSIDNTNPYQPVITLDSPLLYKHYAGVDTFGTETLTVRAEVGLLTRNVVYRGDPETSPTNQYGAQIMMHTHTDTPPVGKISYIECYYVGQAFQVGRYPIHFHLAGIVYDSYIIGNSVHDTFNRAVTIHGTHYLRVEYNGPYILH